MTRSQEDERCQISLEEDEKGATERDKREGSNREGQTRRERQRKTNEKGATEKDKQYQQHL